MSLGHSLRLIMAPPHRAGRPFIIAGAAAVDIASALLLTGLTTQKALRHSEIRPSYLIHRLG